MVRREFGVEPIKGQANNLKLKTLGFNGRRTYGEQIEAEQSLVVSERGFSGDHIDGISRRTDKTFIAAVRRSRLGVPQIHFGHVDGIGRLVSSEHVHTQDSGPVAISGEVHARLCLVS